MRGIRKTTVENILKETEEAFTDTQTGYYVAVKRVRYHGEKRPVAVIFERRTDVIEVVTVFSTKEREMQNRVIGGRWKYENTVN